MRSFLQTLAFFLGLFSFIRPSAFAQISGDWIWYNNAAVAPKFIYDLKQGPDNALWMASETKIVRFDGNNWTSYDYRDAGIDIQVTNYIGNLIRSFAFGPDGKIWCSPYGKVLEFDPLANI